MTDAELQESRIQTVCLIVIATGVAGAALYWLRPVMVPFVLALFLALALRPLVVVQVERAKFPRPLAVLISLVLAAALLYALAALVAASVRQLAENEAVYQAQLIQLVARLGERLPFEGLGLDRETMLAPIRELPMSSVGSFLLGTTNALLDTLSRSLLVLVFMVYLLLGGGGEPVGGVRGDIEMRVERYIATKVLVSAATGILVGGILMLLGVELALVFGLAAFLLNFIPSVGSAVATLLPLPVVIVSPEISSAAAVAAILIPGAIQFAIGNVLEPKLMGDALDLHPIAILMALILWGMLWGIPGMFLATPITAMMKILFEQLEPTRPLGEMLAGRIGVANAPSQDDA